MSDVSRSEDDGCNNSNSDAGATGTHESSPTLDGVCALGDGITGDGIARDLLSLTTQRVAEAVVEGGHRDAPVAG